MILRLVLALAALADLALARLVPDVGPGTYFRLAAAIVVVLLPGALVAEALGRRAASATLAWTLAVLTGALALTFALGRSLTFTLVLLGLVSVAALALGRGREVRARAPGSRLVFLAGALLGLALWRVAGFVDGDGLFHLARVRKLLAFDDLSLSRVSEFADGGLHPGYAFPLWHGFLALVSKLAGVDPELVVLHLPSVLAPFACLVVFEAGWALFRSAWLGAATLAGNVALIALAPGNGGAFTSLALPATAARQLLVPAVLALVFAAIEAPSAGLLASVSAAGLSLALVHPTYALFVALPLGGFLVVRAFVERVEATRLAAALAALLVPTGAVLLWLLPIVRETASYSPGADELERALARYGSQLELLGGGSYRLAPEVVSRGGAVAVGALALVPLALLAGRQRWSAWVLGGSVAVLVPLLEPELFTRLSDAVSLSQSRRLAGFVPFAFALAGAAAVLARLVGLLAVAAGLAAGLALQSAFPGDFTPGLAAGGGPAVVTWIAAVGGALGAVVVAVRGRRLAVERAGPAAALAVLAFTLPVGAHAARTWTPSDARRPSPLTPGLVEALRERVPRGAIVFSDLETSYRIAAAAPVYLAAAPPAHVADTERNRPYERREDVIRFLRTGALGIPRRAGAGWLVLDRRRSDLRPRLRAVYADRRYALYRLGSAA